MNTPRPRVFVSSVITGYEEHREAARAGIRQAGCEPVLVEDFPAHGASPRNACLDGLQSADALVLLLGPRYGWVAPSGSSATEEEYRKARRRHMRILVFVQDAAPREREREQQRFVKEVQSYIHGHFRKSFQKASDLKQLVLEAVVSADLGAIPRSQHNAEHRIQAALNRKPRHTQYSVWMATVWTTLRNEKVVDPLAFDDDVFETKILRLGHTCDPPLFSYKQTTNPREVTASWFRIIQGEPQAPMPDIDTTIVTIYANGTLAVLQNVSGDGVHQAPFYDVVRIFRLDPNLVRDRLKRAWCFAAGWWSEQDSFLRHDVLLYNVALYGIGSRAFEDPRDHQGSAGLAIPPECPHNPLIVLAPSQRVSRSELISPGKAINRIIKTIRLRFREWANNPM